MPTFNGKTGDDIMDYSHYSYAPPANWSAEQTWLNLNGLAGNDTIKGSIYNDGIDGGDGNDTLYGNDGNDLLKGGAGTDILYGGNGNDFLYGGADDDHLYGGNGNDLMYGDAGNDYMEGGDNNDTLVGGIGNDKMLGQAGDDKLFGQDGVDILYGGAGADTLDGGPGSDVLVGGSGNDHYVYNGQGFDHVRDGLTETNMVRTDSTYDTGDVLTVSYTDADLYYSQNGDDLWISSLADHSDDSLLENAVIIDNFFLGGHNVIEYLVTANGAGLTYDLTSLLAA